MAQAPDMAQATRAPTPNAGNPFDAARPNVPTALAQDDSADLPAKAARMIPLLEAEALETSKRLYG